MLLVYLVMLSLCVYVMKLNLFQAFIIEVHKGDFPQTDYSVSCTEPHVWLLKTLH